MTRRSPNYFGAAALLVVLLILSGCGGDTVPDSAGSAEQVPAAAIESLETKTPLPLPEEVPPADYPPDAYPAAQDAPGAGGMRTFFVDTQASSAAYLVDEEFFEDALAKLGINAGENAVVGTTENVSGQIEFSLSGANPVLGDTQITADLSALRTDQNQRDNWIQDNGPRFANFPQATFTATAIEGLPESTMDGQEVSFQLHGDLTVRDTTLPVTFDVRAALDGDTLMGTAETRLLMSDFGIDPPSFARTLTVEDEFGLRVEIVARE